MNTTNKNITLKGNKMTVVGRELHVGDALPKYKHTGVDMADVDNSRFAGKVLVVASVPSIDTPVCAIEAKRFNQEVAALGNDVAVLVVSVDLPMAQKRYCAAEGVDKLTTASDYKYRAFGEDFGVYMQENGLLARAVFVVDKAGKIQHVEYVPEIAQEPDYSAALTKAKALV